MKQRPQFRTIATVAFLSLFLAACSGTDTKEQEAAAAAAAEVFWFILKCA